MKEPIDHLSRLRGVHPCLAGVIILAAVRYQTHREDPQTFVRVTEGVRSPERQRALVRSGDSWTMDSYHLKGLAVDVALFPRGEVTWDFEHYRDFSEYVLDAAQDFGVLITWGGEWQVRDGCHFQLEARSRF